MCMLNICKKHSLSSTIYSIIVLSLTHSPSNVLTLKLLTTAELTTSICKLFIYTVTTLARQNGFHMAIIQNNNNCRERRIFSQQYPAPQSETISRQNKTKQDTKQTLSSAHLDWIQTISRQNKTRQDTRQTLSSARLDWIQTISRQNKTRQDTRQTLSSARLDWIQTISRQNKTRQDTRQTLSSARLDWIQTISRQNKTRQDTRQTLSSAQLDWIQTISKYLFKYPAENKWRREDELFYITVGLVWHTKLLYLVELISLKGYTT